MLIETRFGLLPSLYMEALMRGSEPLDQNTSNLIVPYHGGQEGPGRMFLILISVEGAMAIALPWLDLRFAAHHFGGHHVWIALATDTLCLTALLGFYRVYQRLSLRISQGGEEASYLDSIRMNMATATGSLLFAGLMLHMCGTWITR